MREEWNFHRIWITMENSLVKWAPGLLYIVRYTEHMTYISQGESCENLGHLNLYRGILLYYHMIVIYAIPIIITVTLYARIIKVLVASIETAKDMTGQVALQCTKTRDQYMGLLPDTQNCGSRMSRECRERFPRHCRLAIPTCIKARVWRPCRDTCRGR